MAWSRRDLVGVFADAYKKARESVKREAAEAATKEGDAGTTGPFDAVMNAAELTWQDRRAFIRSLAAGPGILRRILGGVGRSTASPPVSDAGLKGLVSKWENLFSAILNMDGSQSQDLDKDVAKVQEYAKDMAAIEGVLVRQKGDVERLLGSGEIIPTVRGQLLYDMEDVCDGLETGAPPPFSIRVMLGNPEQWQHDLSTQGAVMQIRHVLSQIPQGGFHDILRRPRTPAKGGGSAQEGNPRASADDPHGSSRPGDIHPSPSLPEYVRATAEPGSDAAVDNSNRSWDSTEAYRRMQEAASTGEVSDPPSWQEACIRDGRTLLR
jgi:hypothetical protein